MSTSPYHQSGKLLQQILSERKSIKTVAFSKFKLICSKSTYAQVCSTIQHKGIIDSILNYNSNHLRKAIQMDSFRNEGLVYVLLYELLFGKYHNIRGGGKVKRSIMKFEKELNATKTKIVMEKQGHEKQLIPVFPRYVRVNKLKATTEEVVRELQKQLDASKEQFDGPKEIYQDAHVPDLLVISPKAAIQWHDSALVKFGKVVLQDKSSCFSALALVHGSNQINDSVGDFIDATAAPGNKTLHLASLVYDKILKIKSGEGKSAKNQKNVNIFAFDRSSSRISILKERLSSLAPSVVLDDNQTNTKKVKKGEFPINICPRHEDFLKVDPKDKKYNNVTSILLDPSCSGSGIVNSPDRIADTTKANDSQENRIESLSNFQLVALKHAMSFPQCLRIVYSTCSVDQRENEDVVAAALHETNQKIDDENMKWELVAPMSLGHWERRGMQVGQLSKEQSECLIRADGMDGDDTNGFFVSYFERKRIRNGQSKPVNLVGEPAVGITATYDGEFAVKINIEKDDILPDKASKSSGDELKSKKPGMITKPRDVRAQKQLPKKASKKLQWKQKQKEMKLERLKKKKT